MLLSWCGNLISEYDHLIDLKITLTPHAGHNNKNKRAWNTSFIILVSNVSCYWFRKYKQTKHRGDGPINSFVLLKLDTIVFKCSQINSCLCF